MAKQMMDIALDSTGIDLEFTNGDLAITESTREHQRQLLLNGKGDFKENPTICVGMAGYLDNEGFSDLVRDTGIEFTRDGMTVNNMQLMPDGSLNIDAGY